MPLLYALLQRIQLRPPKVESQQAVYRMFYSCNLDFRGLRFHIHTFTRCVARSIRPTRRNFPREFAFINNLLILQFIVFNRFHLPRLILFFVIFIISLFR